MAGLIGIILFTILSLWGYLFSIINATDYTNPGWSILIYNNELYADTEVRQYAQISNGANLIGPITLLFDLRSNAAQIMKKNSVSIKGFMIDSDGWVCNDGGSIVSGSNVITEKSIICTFDKIKTYNITGTYTIMNRSGEEQNVAMGIDPIEIRGLISITKSKNIQGKNIITLDAGSLKKIANPQWIYLPSGKIAPSSSITEILTTIPTYVCLRLLTMNCDHLFVLEDTDAGNVDGSISSIQDNVDPLLYHLSISGSSIDANQITNVEWLVYNDKGSQTVICTGWGDTCDYRFTSYGIQSIRAVMILANMKKIPLEGEVSVREPLKLKKNMKVMDANGSILNTQDTYQADLKAYVIENTLTPPADLTLDARDITLSNDGYSLKSVVWKISNGKKTEEQRWEKISITLNEPLRYTIEAYYTFQRTNTLEVETAKDSVIIDIERKSLMPRLDISIDSDYVPSLVTVDASQSQSENGEIKKFIFNFWDGKDPAVGDAIQKYEYVTPGDKEISVTIISESGERATIKKTIVLKDVAKTIDFTPSLSSGIVGAPVDFETIDTNGQIEDYIWSFGDNTATLRGNNTTHIFTKPGVYLISLTVIYTDGTRKTESKKFEVTSGG